MFKKYIAIAAISCLPFAAHAATVTININFITGFTQDNSFTITDSNGDVVASENSATFDPLAFDSFTQDYDLGAPGDFTFTLLDSFGDGILDGAGIGFVHTESLVNISEGPTLLFTTSTEFSTELVAQFTLTGGAPVNAVPLPATLPALALGLGGLGLMRRKHRANG